MVIRVTKLLVRVSVGLGAGMMCVPACLADAAKYSQPLINRLDAPTRAKVILALGGLALLGLLLMGLTWLAFRMLRRQFRHTEEVIERQNKSQRDEDWARKPLTDGGDANKL